MWFTQMELESVDIADSSSEWLSVRRKKMDVINLRGMRVVYSERVYRALAIAGYAVNERREREPQNGRTQIEHMAVMVINEDGNVVIIDDEAWMFQFLPEPTREVE